MKLNLPDKTNQGIPHMIRVIANRGREIPGFLSFALGNPSKEAIPLKEMQKAIIDCASDNPFQFLQYGDSAGYRPLLEQTKYRLIHTHHLPEEERDLLMLSGSGQGLGLAPRTFCREGDEVYVEELSYTNALNAILNCGCKPVSIARDRFGMIPSALEEAVLAGHGRMIYLNPVFQNPTGLTMPLKRRKEIYEIASRYNLLIYEDDPYGEIRFRGEPVPAFASFDTDGRVIYAGSYSKTLSAGMRVGFLYAQTSLIAALRKVKESTEGQIAHINEMIISKTLSSIDYDEHIRHISALYKSKCDLMASTLRSCAAPGLIIDEPDGGMFLWITFPSDVNTDEVLEAALSKGVGIVPGKAFAADQSISCTSFRLNFTFSSDDDIKKGMEILGELSRKFCK